MKIRTMYKKQIIMACLMLTMSLSANAQKRVYPHVFAPSEGLVNRMEQPYRSEICLNGYWDFQPIETPKDFTYGKGIAPDLPQPQDKAWDKTRIKIPSPWNINDFAYRGLEGPDHRNYPSYPKEWEKVKMAWMRKTIKVPSDWQGRRIQLHFEAVAGMTEVYVNGEKVGENFDLFLPFTLDITKQVVPGEKAEILVGVRSQWLFEDRSTVGRRIVPGGSMWGYAINGIWQDVYMVALPQVYVKDIYVKPLVSKEKLQLEVSLKNTNNYPENISLQAIVNEWNNLAGTDINTAPIPAWSLGQQVLSSNNIAVKLDALSEKKITMELAVPNETLRFWTPEHPNLYALLLKVKDGKRNIDVKYERFGWREWTFNGTQLLLNGEPRQLKSDSWHFMGIPQMTRRYAWSWYTAIKQMNGNAVRLHAQVYPRLYMDMADEMGICILDETANWASDGGPKLDSELFFQHSRDHLRRFVERDRNHPSVFGWSISNENKPVILYVFKRPDLLPRQKEEWGVWRDIVRQTDPTRPWISSDGEDDGDGMLPVTVGHYGDLNAMKRWQEIGKPWGIGETGMCYYGTPQQVSKYNGQRAYESAEGRMEGLANECYSLIKEMRQMGASYTTVFNMAWYALKPLPLGKKDLTTAPTMDDGIFFNTYLEGVPGVQPERIGPYCTTFNPGYDPSLPLFSTWPLYDAIRAANAEPQSVWSKWAEVDTLRYRNHAQADVVPYDAVIYTGNPNSSLGQLLVRQGVILAGKPAKKGRTLYIVDGADKNSRLPSLKNTQVEDILLWGVTPETLGQFGLPLQLDKLKRSSFIPEDRSWTAGMQNADFYFCEVQKTDASCYSLKGRFVDEGEILLRACRTDWRRWNQRPEELKTAGLLRSEYETTQELPVIVKNKNIYVTTLVDFTLSEKGLKTLSTLFRNAGISFHQQQTVIKGEGIDRDPNNLLLDPSVDTSKKSTK